MRPSTALPSPSSTSPKTTRAPSRVNISASTAPMPRAPPLISATLPASLVPIAFLLSTAASGGPRDGLIVAVHRDDVRAYVNRGCRVLAALEHRPLGQ